MTGSFNYGLLLIRCCRPCAWYVRAILATLVASRLKRLEILNEVNLLAPLEVRQELFVELALKTYFKSLLQFLLRSGHFTDQQAELEQRLLMCHFGLLF